MRTANCNALPDHGQAQRGCACPDPACGDPNGHLWNRAEVAHVARNSPITVGKHARERPSCPLYKLGNGRGSQFCTYTWPEVEAYLRWLTGGRALLLRPSEHTAVVAPAHVLVEPDSHQGLQIDPRQRKGGVTIYVRGKLLPDLLDLLREQHPELQLGRTLNLRTFGIATVEQAHRWIAEQWRQVMRLRRGDALDLTLADALGSYESHLQADRDRPFAPATITGRLLTARRLVELLGADRLASSLGAAELPEIAKGVQAQRTARSSRAKARAGARQFLAWLVDQGASPLLDAAVLRRAFSDAEGGLAPKVPPRWLRRDELAALVDALDGLGEQLAGFVRLLLLTGPRLHSALELHWQPDGPESGWVDLDAGLVHYWSRKTRSFHLWRLAWSPSVWRWLEAQPKREGLVFEGLTPGALDYALRETRREGGETVHPDGPLRRAVPGLRWKDMRSTCASYLHNASGVAGGTLEKAQALGHKVSTAERDYVGAGCVVVREAKSLEEAMSLSPTGRGPLRVLATRPGGQADGVPLPGSVQPRSVPADPREGGDPLPRGGR